MNYRNFIVISLLTVVGIQASEVSNEATLAHEYGAPLGLDGGYISDDIEALTEEGDDQEDWQNLSQLAPCEHPLLMELRSAIIEADLKRVKEVVEQCKKDGESIDGTKASNGKYFWPTPLMTACSLRPADDMYYEAVDHSKDQERLAIVKYLIESNADVNAKNEEFSDYGPVNPLHWALEQGTLRYVELLLEAGARLHPKSILAALYTVHGDIDARIQLLIKNGAVGLKEIIDEDDRSNALHRAAFRGNAKAVDYLLKNGFSVHEKNELGQTPLHLAVDSDNDYVVKMLLAAGARAEDVDIEGFDLAKMSRGKQNIKRAVVLARIGDQLECQLEGGQTPLMLAAAIGDQGLITAILQNHKESGASLKSLLQMRDKNGFTAFLHAVRNEQIECMFQLLDAGAQLSDRDYKGRDVKYWTHYDERYLIFNNSSRLKFPGVQARLRARDLMRVACHGLNEQETKAMLERQAQRTEEEQKAIEDLRAMIPGPGRGTGHINALIAQYVGGQAEQEESMEDEGIADLFPE